jgi:hypothetical protein
MSIIEELRKWIKIRPKMFEGAGMSTQIGSGKVVETVTSSIQNFVTTLQERRPKIIPTVMETIKIYEPGKMVKTVVEQATKTVQQITGKVTVTPPSPTLEVVTSPTTLLRKVK